MSIYLVVLNEPDEGAWERLKNKWPKPNHYILTDRLAFISPKEVLLTEDITHAVGMNNEFDTTGFVTEVRYGTINGWNRQALWEWLEKNQ